jgi:hypothetical protein
MPGVAVEDFMAAGCGPVVSTAAARCVPVAEVMRDADTGAERAMLAADVMLAVDMGIAGPVITVAVIIAEWEWA